MNELQKRLKDMVAMFIANEQNLTDQMVDEKVDEVAGMPSFSTISPLEKEEVKAALKSEFSIKLDIGTLVEAKGHKKWFLDQKSKLPMKYWERYKKYLLSDKGFSTKVVNTMDDVLDTLTDLLGNPQQEVAYKRRGLIIGDVQSGKTANYTGLICKAADSGYKVIVLLTGTIEKLRQQTQQRIDEGFVGKGSDAMIRMQDDKLIIGAGKYDSSVSPAVLTSTVDDFKQKNATNLNFDLRNINGPVIFVIKKNAAVLRRLNKWLKKNQIGSQKINHALLVIDDEADNASVNTKSNPDDSPTAINGQIRELLNLFSRSSYVGFTATPYANIFIDPDNFNDVVEDDLFPKDYIYSLNSPSNYTGARNIFNEDGDSRYMLVTINDDPEDPESIAHILPLKHKSDATVEALPADLKSAICTFMIANAIEDLEGMSGNHRSMLINVSRFTDVQDQVASLANDYLKELQAACRNYGALPTEAALESSYIHDIYSAYKWQYENTYPSWDDIQIQLHESCAGIIVQTFNIRAGQNVNYSDYDNGLRVIAVGGMSLSRGLTLEGLVVSYFYRNSKMYDTLMQMGRWFGYRKGYDKLCRIWMSEESIEWYSHISQATDELRSEIKRYEDTGLTPMDFGLRVRSDINALLVTARNKMRSAESRDCLISLSGEAIETAEIYSDEKKNIINYNATVELIDKLKDSGFDPQIESKRNGNRCGFRNIPSHFIMDFLSELEISPKNDVFNVASICNFINDYRGKELEHWDIYFPTGTSEESADFGNGIQYHFPKRSFTVENDKKILKMSGSKRRLGTAADGQYGLDEEKINSIKEAYSPNSPSQKAYFRIPNRNPLLCIYMVELGELLKNKEITNSQIKEYSKEFIGKKVMGFGIGIPQLSDSETKYARYMLNKIAVSNMFEGEMDEWEEGEDD